MVQMHILVFANECALNTLSNVDVRYIHLYAKCAFYAHSHVSVLYMQIICTWLYDCAKEARMVIIISLPTPIRPIAILNKLIEKRM